MGDAARRLAPPEARPVRLGEGPRVRRRETPPGRRFHGGRHRARLAGGPRQAWRTDLSASHRPAPSDDVEYRSRLEGESKHFGSFMDERLAIGIHEMFDL